MIENHEESRSRRLASARRLRGFIRKEFIQVFRDPSSIGIAFVLPVVLLLLFGYGVSLDAQGIRLAVVIDRPSHDAQSFVSQFERSHYFVVLPMDDQRQAERELRARRADAILRLQDDFAARSQFGPSPAPIQLVINGVDGNTARQVDAYVHGVWRGWLARRAANGGEPLDKAVTMESRVWFNSEVRSRNFLIPGLIAVIMTLIGAMLTSMVVAREWERGTMEALLSTPVRMWEVLAGKLIPYFALGMGGLSLSLAMAVWLFDVPLRGSLLVMFLASALFLITALGMGLLISSIAHSQFMAGHIAIITTFLPAFILSGFIFDIHSMPAAVQVVTYLIAARYYVAILQSVFLAGDVWVVIWPNAAALALMSIVFLGLVRRSMRKGLE